MKRAIRILAPAEDDMRDAMAWYAAIRPILAEDFLLCVDAVLERLAQDATIFPYVHGSVRCALIHRFPYGVFFRIDDGDAPCVTVVAVFHTRRTPVAWQTRL